MADSIGGSNTFLFLRGPIHAPGTKVEEITRPGVDYHAFRTESLKASRSKLVGFRDIASATSAHALRTTYAALEGTIVTIVQQGRSYANMLIISAEVSDIVPFGKAVGGIAGGTWGVFSEWEIIYAGNSWSIS